MRKDLATPPWIIQRNREYTLNYLSTHPCVDCGETDSIVLQFDHTDPSLKTDRVANMVFNSSLATLQSEIDKCEVRCANCHSRKTARDRKYYRHMVNEESQ